MPSRLQEERIGIALQHLERDGGIATARQVWLYISHRWPRRPGFRNRQSVEQCLAILRRRSHAFDTHDDL